MYIYIYISSTIKLRTSKHTTRRLRAHARTRNMSIRIATPLKVPATVYNYCWDLKSTTGRLKYVDSWRYNLLMHEADSRKTMN